jgi:tetratricopeptide (TPR) repeat protein
VVDDGGEEGGVDTQGDTDGVPLDPEAHRALMEEQFREHIKNAERAFENERHNEAIREYEAAKEIEDGDPQVLRGLAHAKHARTRKNRCPSEAIQDLLLVETFDPMGLWLDERQYLVEWAANCRGAFDADRLRLAEEMGYEKPTDEQGREADGRPAEIRVIAAQLRAAIAADAENEQHAKKERMRALDHLEAYQEECLAFKPPHNPSPQALWLQGSLHEELGNLQPAVTAFETLVKLYPEDDRASRASEFLTDWQIELEVRRMEKTQGGKPSAEAEAAYRRGIAAIREGKLGIAESELDRAVKETPYFPEAQFQLGRVLARTGKYPEAIERLRHAIAMQPQAYEYNMELGLLYYKRYTGAKDADARRYLIIALSLRPDLYQLNYYLGDLYAREGKRELARKHYQSFLDACPDGLPIKQDARDALQDLQREATSEEEAVLLAPREDVISRLDPKLQRIINEAYVVGTSHGDWDGAERVLLRARDEFPDSPELLNELAKVVHVQGRAGEARRHWEDSLQLNPEQWEVHERLGMLIPLPGEAIQHLRSAADNGRPTARYVLAEKLWQQYKWWEASEQLDLYLIEATEYHAMYEQAVQRREQWTERFRSIYLGAGLLSVLLLSFPISRVYRRLRGASLSQLLEREPKSFPDVARILSLIRHEILKHNTAFLSDVGQALEMGEVDADVRTALLARRLFGDQHRDPDLERLGGGERHGIYGRFLGYCHELQQVARSYGVTLNLYRKDPIFSQMLRAFEDVAERAKWLRNPDSLRQGQRLELSKTLLRSGHVLGRKAFERLSGIIQELCIVTVDEALVQEVFQRVSQEDQFEGIPMAPLSVDGVGAKIRIFRTDLEDVLANVFRNSLRSSVQYAEPPVGLGIELMTEVDEITGLASLAIRVKDRSSERLTNEMLRGRYVERGMGITADLLSKYDASIAVESEPGWEKAVVLRFFTVEDSA